MIKIITSVVFSSCFLFHLTAQTRFDIPVRLSPGELSMPWTGGFNAPQFSNIDFNRDGITDMISFDRQGDVLRTYVRLPASGRWIQHWPYEDFFPDLVDWVRIVDYDKDGIEDIFTSSSKSGVAGITVYKGSFENDIWTFTMLTDRGKEYLQIPVGQGLTNLYVSWDDIPEIRDVDMDGDADVLAFEPGGSFIAYYRNVSVEMGWGLDSLRFVLDDACWGKILENELSEEVFLSDDPFICSDGQFTGEEPIVPRHAGSTVSAWDYDFDGDLDAWLGDITSRRLVFLHNGLNNQDAWITSQDAHFPSDDEPVDIPYFVAAYFVELDDDPEPEILAAVNSRALAEDRRSVWRYDDDPGDGPLQFSLTEKGWLQNQTIDVGSHSRPAFADINGDGLQDLVIGGYRYTDGPQTRIPSLWLYRNVGTISNPHFEFVTDDYLGMSVFGSHPTFDFAPAFGDLDNNGSVDLVVGEQNGQLFYYKNTSAKGDSMIFAPPVFPFMGISVGVSATPQIADINEDGLSDLVIGERTGNSDNNGRCSNLNYFQNTGTAGDPVFISSANTPPNTQCFGRILFDIPIGLPQYSTPFIFKSDEGLMLMTGADNGDIHLYTNLENGINGSLTLVELSFGELDFGNRSAPALADLNNDGEFELAVGNQRGGLEMLSIDIQVGTTSTRDQAGDLKPYFFRQSRNVIEIVWNDKGSVAMTDIAGRMLFAQPDNGHHLMDVSSIPAGIYFIQLKEGRSVWVEKIIKP